MSRVPFGFQPCFILLNVLKMIVHASLMSEAGLYAEPGSKSMLPVLLHSGPVSLERAKYLRKLDSSRISFPGLPDDQQAILPKSPVLWRSHRYLRSAFPVPLGFRHA